MKKNDIKKIIFFIFLIFLNSVFSKYFFYEAMTNDSSDNTIIISLKFNTEQNIYINNQNIHCFSNRDKKEAKLSLPNILGTMYLKDSKVPLQVLSGSGLIECSFEQPEEIIESIELNYTVFDIKTNSLDQRQEIIIIPNLLQKKIDNTLIIENGLIKNKNSFLGGIMDYTKDSHFLLIAFVTFILGILMSLTPCIYPMIPITISILGIDKKNFSERLYAGILYVLGISVTFSIFGILAASGKLFFGQLLTMPIFTIITTIILFFMTLQMLGIIDSIISINTISMPVCLQDSRYLPFVYGIFSGTITSPCVSPGLIGILSLVGQQNNIFIGWLWLFTFGVGLALPLLLIALVMNSGFIFPKSGSWMNELKEIIGIALVFILNSNLLLLMNYYIAFAITIGILLSFLIYKYRLFDHIREVNKYWFCSFSAMLAIMMILFFIFTGYHKYQLENKIVNTIKIQWCNNFEKAIEKGLVEKKLILLDFTADWCSLCQVVDKEIFKDNKIMHIINDQYIFCKIDCTEMDAIKESLIKKYQINGFPGLLIINPQNKEMIQKYSSEILDIKKSLLIKLLQEMHKKYNE